MAENPPPPESHTPTFEELQKERTSDFVTNLVAWIILAALSGIIIALMVSTVYTIKTISRDIQAMTNELRVLNNSIDSKRNPDQ